MLLPPLVPGRFVRRLNRFAATVKVEGRSVEAHVPNSGRLHELFLPGAEVRLAPQHPSPTRRTAYDMALVRVGRQWVAMDARKPPAILLEALEAGRVAPFAGCRPVAREPVYGAGRFDLELACGGQRCLVETKSVTLVVEGCALFPDAPTERGRRHLRELVSAVQAGLRAAVVFIVQRPDAGCFAPHVAADPAFARALRQAAQAGVAVHAYRCHVDPQRIELLDEVLLRL